VFGQQSRDGLGGGGGFDPAQGPALLLEALAEGRPVLGDRLVKNRFFGPAARVAVGTLRGVAVRVSGSRIGVRHAPAAWARDVPKPATPSCRPEMSSGHGRDRASARGLGSRLGVSSARRPEEGPPGVVRDARVEPHSTHSRNSAARCGQRRPPVCVTPATACRGGAQLPRRDDVRRTEGVSFCTTSLGQLLAGQEVRKGLQRLQSRQDHTGPSRAADRQSVGSERNDEQHEPELPKVLREVLHQGLEQTIPGQAKDLVAP